MPADPLEGSLIRIAIHAHHEGQQAKETVRFLTEEERDKIFVAAEAHSRDAYLLMTCGAYLGLRKGELCALRWEDIDLDARVVHVRNSKDFTTKSGRNRAVPICDELLKILRQHHRAEGFVLKPKNKVTERTKKSRYRWDFRGLFASIIASAGLDPHQLSPHSLRHCFASLYAQDGESLFKIATWMGHSNTTVTELYSHLNAYDPAINRTSKGLPESPAPEPATARVQLRIVK